MSGPAPSDAGFSGYVRTALPRVLSNLSPLRRPTAMAPPLTKLPTPRDGWPLT